MSNDIFFFDPGMTNIDTVIFGPEDVAVEIVNYDTMRCWAIVPSYYVHNPVASWDLYHAWKAAHPRIEPETFKTYSESEFRNLFDFTCDMDF